MSTTLNLPNENLGIQSWPLTHQAHSLLEARLGQDRSKGSDPPSPLLHEPGALYTKLSQISVSKQCHNTLHKCLQPARKCKLHREPSGNSISCTPTEPTWSAAVSPQNTLSSALFGVAFGGAGMVALIFINLY